MTDQVDPLVTEVLKITKAGEDDLNTRRLKYNDAYDTYRATERKPAELEPWQHNFRVPWGMYIVDTEMVNIVTGNKPACRILPRSPHWANNAKWFQSLMNYFTDRQHLAELQTPVTQQGLIYGLTIGKTGWDYKTSNKTMNTPQYGPDGNVSWLPQKINVCDYDGPYIQPWSVYDSWWDPAGSDPDSCRWWALRAYLSEDDLRMNQCMVPHEHYPAECTGQFHNVEQLIAKGPGTKPSNTAQDRATRTDPRSMDGLYEIVEYWWDDRLVVIGEKTILLRDIDNPHWHGRKPVVAACTRPDLFKVQGIPEAETIDPMQRALWEVHNGRMDNFLLTIMRGFTVRETSTIDPKTTKITPRAMIPVTDHDDLRPIELPPLPAEAYQEQSSLLGFLQQITGVSPYVSGSNLDTVDQNTATGISVLQEVASRMLRFKASQIHWRYWTRTFENWGQDTQQFLTRSEWVRIVSPGADNKYEFREVGPAEVAGDYDFSVVGTEESLSKQQERSEAMSLLNAFAPLAPLNIIDWKPILVKVAEAFDFEDPEELFLPPAPPQAAAPGPGGPSPNGAGSLGASGPGQPGPPSGGPPGASSDPRLDPRMQAVLGAVRGR